LKNLRIEMTNTGMRREEKRRGRKGGRRAEKR
jgi:hypothetical protein